ncbi:MAG: hypothetical protein WC460_03085 [Patescibacteria group bacterium]
MTKQTREIVSAILYFGLYVIQAIGLAIILLGILNFLVYGIPSQNNRDLFALFASLYFAGNFAVYIVYLVRKHIPKN